MNLHRRSEKISPALRYGKVMHTILEYWYKTGSAKFAKYAAEQKHAKDFTYGFEDYRTLERALVVFDDYVIRWGDTEARNERTLGFPDSPLVELSTNVILPRVNVPYAVRIDRVFEYQGGVYIEDHKTTSMFGATYYDEWEGSPQMMGYFRAAQLLLDFPIRGVRINVVVTRKTNHEFDRRIVYFPDELVEQWEDERGQLHHEIQERHRTGVWPRQRANCAGRYGMCAYNAVCTAPPSEQQKILEADFSISPWDPSAQHDE